MRFPGCAMVVTASLQLGLIGCRPEPRLAVLQPVAQASLEQTPAPTRATKKKGTPVAALAVTPSGLITPGAAVQLRLPGGALLVLHEDHIVKTVALQAWVSAGAADEPEDRLGIAHLTERVLFHELAQAPAQRVQQSGGDATSWTTPDHTVFQVLVPSSRWLQGVEILSAVFGARHTELGVTDAAVERQRQAILAELRQDAAVPERAAMQALLGLSFAVHPYRRPLLGRPETVGKLTKSAVAEFFATRYNAARITLVVTGDFDANQVATRLGTELGAALCSTQAVGSVPPERPAEPPQQAPRVAVLPGEPGRARVLLGFHVPSARSVDVAALEVAAVLLGYGEAARLQRELSRLPRLEGSEDPTAVSYTARDPGLFLAGVTVAPTQVEEAAHILTSEALRLGQREVSNTDLQRAQRLLRADAAYLRETPIGRARRLGFFHSLELLPGEHERQVQALTPLALRQALGRYLTAENLNLVVLRPRAVGSASAGRSDAATADAALLHKLQLQLAQIVATSRPLRPAPMTTKLQQVQSGVFEYTLPSGVRLLIVPEHSVEIVGIAALWPGGLRFEDERTAGAHQLLARLWPRSARTRTAEAMARELEQISGMLQPVVELDAFGLRAELVSSHLDQGLALLADCLSQPSFSEADADRERRSLIVELRGELRATPPALSGSLDLLAPSNETTVAQLLPRDDAATAALRLFKSALLPGHPYALEPSVLSIGGLSRRRLLELFRRSYPLNKLTIAVVGDVDPAMVVERLEGRLPAAPAAGPVTPPNPVNAVASAFPEVPVPIAPWVQYLPGQHAHMVLGFRAPGLPHAERYAVEVLFELLAGPAGRLGRELKEKRGLAYAVQGVLQQGLDLGYLAFHLAASPSTLDVAQTGLREELHKLLDHLVSPSELALAQDLLISRRAAGRQRREGRALELARAAALALPAAQATTEAYEAGVRAVSSEVVQRVARQYLSDQRAAVAAVLPEALQRHAAGHSALVALMQAHDKAPEHHRADTEPRGVRVASRHLTPGIAASPSSHGKSPPRPDANKKPPAHHAKGSLTEKTKMVNKVKPAHKH